MKKLFLITTMLLIITLMTACDSGPSAFDLLERSLVAQENFGSLAMEMDIEISIRDVDVERARIIRTLRIERESEERIKVDTSTLRFREMGEMWSAHQRAITTFLRAGYEYTETNFSGQIERTHEIADITRAAEITEIFSLDFITEARLDSSAFSTTDNGYRLAFTLNRDGLMALFDKIEMLDDITNFGIDEIEEWDVSIYVYLNEDYLPIASQLNMNVETAETVLFMSIAVNNQDLVINFPYWLDVIGTIPAPGCNQVETPDNLFVDTTGVEWCVLTEKAIDGYTYSMLVTRRVHNLAGIANEEGISIPTNRNHSINEYIPWPNTTAEAGGPEARYRIHRWFNNDEFVSPELRARAVDANIPNHPNNEPDVSFISRNIDMRYALSTPIAGSTDATTPLFFLSPAELNVYFGTTDEARRAYQIGAVLGGRTPKHYWLRSAGWSEVYTITRVHSSGGWAGNHVDADGNTRVRLAMWARLAE